MLSEEIKTEDTSAPPPCLAEEVPEETTPESNTPTITTTTTTPKVKKLFIGNIAQSTTEETLTEYFSTYGQINELLIMRNSGQRSRGFPEDNAGNHRGFGFIRFESQSVATSVQEQQHTVDGNILTINLAKAKTLKFFVGGIARDRTTTESMRSYFEGFGEIDDIFCIVDRGFGFVTLVDEGQNLKPIINESHHEIDGKLCEVRIARPKEEYQRSLRGGGRGGGRGRGGGYGGGYGGRSNYGAGAGWGYGGGYYGGTPGGGAYGNSYNQWQPASRGGYGSGRDFYQPY